MLKKFLQCLKCNDKKWFEFVSGKVYRCKSCGLTWDYIKLKTEEKKAKDKLKKEKCKNKEMTKKNTREIDSAYLKYIRGNPCLVQNAKCMGMPIDAHHSRRVSQGGSDYSAIPLCRLHHTELHTIGVLSFADKYSITYESEVKRLREKYEGNKKRYKVI